jgi:hypothetical protein
MSYSISKKNYIINAVSYGRNRTQRGSTDFGIYEPSSESDGAEPSFPTRALEGPQVTFGEDVSRGSGFGVAIDSPDDPPISFGGGGVIRTGDDAFMGVNTNLGGGVELQGSNANSPFNEALNDALFNNRTGGGRGNL